MPIIVVEGPTIAAGQSLSDAIDLTAGRPVRLTMPAGWTPANLTFQISTDGQFFNDLYALDGRRAREVLVGGVSPGIGVALAGLTGNVHYRVRSGTARNPVPQSEERVFAVAIETPETTP